MKEIRLDPERGYRLLLALHRDMPELEESYPDRNAEIWLSKAQALLEALDDTEGKVAFRIARGELRADSMRHSGAARIREAFDLAIARAELAAPASVQGAFIPVGASYDAFAAISRVLSRAEKLVLIVDPYLNFEVLQEFGPLVPEGVPLRMLMDGRYAALAETLRTGAKRWSAQYGSTRPLEVRATPPRKLHDRLIFVDGAEVWSLSQSMKDIAQRAHASLNRLDQEVAALKIEVYTRDWEEASPLTEPA